MNAHFTAWRSRHGRLVGPLPGLGAVLGRRDVIAGAVASACIAALIDRGASAPLTHGGPRFAPVSERAGAVPWRMLAGITQLPDGSLAGVSPEIMALDGADVVVDGYMIPYDDAPRQRRFLICPSLVDCPYCAPGGASGLIEVSAVRPVASTHQAFSARGRFAVNPSPQAGFLYRLTAARV